MICVVTLSVDMDSKMLFLVSLLLLHIMLKLQKRDRITRKRKRRLDFSASSSQRFVEELLDLPSSNVYELLRMDKNTFIDLCKHFREKGWMEDSSEQLKVEDKITMFLITISDNCQNHLVRNRFQYSTETISKHFHEVLRAMIRFSREMIVPPTFDGQVVEIQSLGRVRHVFKRAIGVIDGILIPAIVPTDKRIPFMGMGGECWQNVMAICDFDMVFTYVVVGWEGIAHDARILTEAILRPAMSFSIPPPDMYYLVDDAYPNTKGFLAPYENVRCSLADFREGNRPRNREELFNHAHAKLRSVIERAFKVLKARFPVLKRMVPYSFSTQKRIVVASMAIHNFIRQRSRNDELFQEYENDDVITEAPEIESDEPDGVFYESTDQAFMSNLRNQIANELQEANV